jgi:ubiquinone/menaquinone biosynthesis C-methylase UbiE
MILHFSDIQNQIQLSKKKTIHSFVTAFSLSRSCLYFFERIPLILLNFLLDDQKQNLKKEDLTRLQQIVSELYLLIQKDSERISAGIYPSQVLSPEIPLNHLVRLLQIWYDGYQLFQRKYKKKIKDFSAEEYEYLKDIPEYSRQNHRFQSGGYLDRNTAFIYEHQLELLFLGAADAMRRMLLVLLKKNYRYSEGEGLRFLELGCGTGRFTYFLKLAFPKAKVVVVDLSYPYLKEAQERLKDFDRVDFIQADVSDLPFKNERYDAVLSCFLFHELPLEIRRKVLSESFRVLSPQGVFALVDSLQKNDIKELNWALSLFSNSFHEAYYENYLMNSIEGLVKNTGFENLESETGFLSKALIARKPKA